MSMSSPGSFQRTRSAESQEAKKAARDAANQAASNRHVRGTTDYAETKPDKGGRKQHLFATNDPSLCLMCGWPLKAHGVAQRCY